MKTATKAFRYTSFALEILERVLGSKFSVQGLEKLPQHPVMFVANHFTRSETFFIPYLIYKYTGRQVRCLADESLYSEFLVNFYILLVLFQLKILNATTSFCTISSVVNMIG